MYRYKPLLRPASFSTLPLRLQWDYVEAPADIAHMRQDIPASKHPYGVIGTQVELSAADLERYDLEFLPEDPELERVVEAASNEAIMEIWALLSPWQIAKFLCDLKYKVEFEKVGGHYQCIVTRHDGVQRSYRVDDEGMKCALFECEKGWV